jgi:hypothetical protein
MGRSADGVATAEIKPRVAMSLPIASAEMSRERVAQS